MTYCGVSQVQSKPNAIRNGRFPPSCGHKMPWVGHLKADMQLSPVLSQDLPFSNRPICRMSGTVKADDLLCAL